MPPPLVFDFCRFVVWKEVLKDCVVKLGVFVNSWVRRWGLERIWEVLGESWARPGRVLGLLLGILVGLWAV